mmetsp:Transcript_7868/g.1033  ORF Transcript_7868/g.1033 Transcript_7868/m.1033 type:complete len:83 (+) Transcript_7868:258-506(+)
MLRQKLLKNSSNKPNFQQRHKEIDLAEINRDIDDMDLYSPSEDESDDENYYGGMDNMDFREIDRELAEDSDSDFTDDDMMSI